VSERSEYDIEELRRRVEEDPGCPEFPALAEAERRAGRAEEARRICEVGLARAPGRLAGRVSLGLALLELGESESAKRELEGILDSALEPHLRAVQVSASSPDGDESAAEESAPMPSQPIAKEPAPMHAAAAPFASVAASSPGADEFEEIVGDAELEQAFASAEPQTDEMFSANEMAEQVLMDRAILDGDQAEDLEMGTSSAYSTETMAGLLERQGDHQSAEAIRRSLEAESAAVPAQGPALEPDWADAAEVPLEATPPEAPHDAREQARILGTLESWLQNIQRGTA
jgi:hypothetical protein